MTSMMCSITEALSIAFTMFTNELLGAYHIQKGTWECDFTEDIKYLMGMSITLML